MRTTGVPELEKIVAGANPHVNKSLADRSTGVQSSGPQAARREVDAIVKEVTARLGVDAGQLDRLRREHEAERRRFVEESKKRAIEGAEQAAQRLNALVAALRVGLGALPDTRPWEPTSFILSKVDFIRAWPSPGNLHDSHQEPGLNWAKYRDPGLAGRGRSSG